MSMPIKVGIVGVNAERGWAATAHIPALRALPAYEIAALSTTRQASADAAGRAFGVGLTFEGHQDLVRSPEVDLVVVTVKVPHHREIVTAAVDAGKAVYCEWPLGRDLSEARAMAEHASEQGISTLIGLQSRRAPAILYVRNLIAHGYLGTVLSTTMVGSSALGGVVDRGNAYTLDKDNAANMLTIAAAHSMDVMGVVLGEFDELSAAVDTRRPDITVLETGEHRRKTSPDQLGVIGRLKSGATASIHFREGHHGGTGFLWEINGSEGTVQLRANGGHPGMFALTVSGSRGREPLTDMPVPPAYSHHTPGIEHLDTMAAGIARVYDSYERDVRSGSANAPHFTQALSTHRLIETIEQAASTGHRTSLVEPPG